MDSRAVRLELIDRLLAGDDDTPDGLGPSSLQGARAFIECCAGGRDIVDEPDVFPDEWTSCLEWCDEGVTQIGVTLSF